jgi:D-alanyl-lipoteichoic acid acyltransferase DltB (MBOAT superfamily)
MHLFVVDLGTPFYWMFLLGTVVVLTVLARPEWRRIAWPIIDVAFVSLIAAWWVGALAIAYGLAIHGAAVAAERSGSRVGRRLALGGGGAVVATLFLLHKLRGEPGWAGASSPLVLFATAVGFSYVALRSVERLRAGVDGAAAGARWFDTLSYLFPFHMLAAGPIQSWTGFWRDRQLSEPPSGGVLDAVDRIVHGLFKKFVLARAIELTLLTGFTAPWSYQLLEVQIYYLWVYLDFSAYSDLAVGAGRLLGAATPENFNRPLGARNIIAFWERWHISLSSFVRRKVFIPVQLAAMRRTGGRHALAIASLAFAISFVLVGLWHGLSWRFLIWGVLHATALIVCNLYQRLVVAPRGARAVAEYMANPFYRAAATVMTFEFVAFSLAFIVHPATAFLDRAR